MFRREMWQGGPPYESKDRRCAISAFKDLRPGRQKDFDEVALGQTKQSVAGCHKYFAPLSLKQVVAGQYRFAVRLSVYVPVAMFQTRYASVVAAQSRPHGP